MGSSEELKIFRVEVISYINNISTDMCGLMMGIHSE